MPMQLVLLKVGLYARRIYLSNKSIYDWTGDFMLGVIHFTDSISARKIWEMSHFTRTQLVSHLFEELDLKRKDDISKEASPPTKNS
jgi:hypothetical protein